jgi:hypothetical protein
MPKTKSKPGPKPTYGDVMDFRITVIVTKKQARIIQSVAAAQNKSASAWARDVLIAALPQELE